MLLIPLVEAPTYQHLPSSSYDKTNYVLRRKKERNAIEYGVCRDEESEKERNFKATHDRFRPFSNASIVPIHQSHLSQRRRSCCVGASGDCCMREEYLSSIHVLKLGPIGLWQIHVNYVWLDWIEVDWLISVSNQLHKITSGFGVMSEAFSWMNERSRLCTTIPSTLCAGERKLLQSNIVLLDRSSLIQIHVP